jgi:hypothetical protein
MQKSGQMKFGPGCGMEKIKEIRFPAQGHTPSADFQASARSPQSLRTILKNKWKNNVKIEA